MGWSIAECFEKVPTYQEFRLWIEWLDTRELTPSIDQYYLMQIAQEVRRVLAKNPNSIKLKDFFLKFGRSGDVEPKQSAEKVSSNALKGWLSSLGNSIKVMTHNLKGPFAND
jgi:hypothetical protein